MEWSERIGDRKNRSYYARKLFFCVRGLSSYCTSDFAGNLQADLFARDIQCLEAITGHSEVYVENLARVPPFPSLPPTKKFAAAALFFPAAPTAAFVGSQIRLRGRWKGDRRRGASARRRLCDHHDISVSLSHGSSSRGKHITRRSSHAGPGTSAINPLKRKRGVYGKKKKMIPVTPQEDLLFASSASESDDDEDTDMSSGSDM
nr:uncharacterized protein LOC109767481 [Aegilops tauschii subsp. strangulata]